MITSSKVSKFLVIIFWFATQTSWALAANENSMTCPPSIAVEQKSNAALEGWEVANDAVPHRLTSVTFFEGHPNEKVSLVNDKEKRTKKEVIQTWQFQRASSNYWLRCSYDRTSVSLSKAIPKDAARCVVTLDRFVRVSGLPKINAMQCH